MAEWLRRWTANPMGSARVSSNLILVDNFFYFFYITFSIKVSSYIVLVFQYSFLSVSVLNKTEFEPVCRTELHEAFLIKIVIV